MNRQSANRRRARLVRLGSVWLAVGFFVGMGACASSPQQDGRSGESEAVGDAASQESGSGAGEEATAEQPTSEADRNAGGQDGADGAGSADTEATENEESASGSKNSGIGRSNAPADKRIERAVQQAEKGGSVDTARRTLERLVDHPEKGHLAAYNLGVLNESSGDLRAAAQRYGQALSKKGGFTPALINLIRLYLRRGQTDDADQVAQKYIERYPDNQDHRAARLEVLLAEGQYQTVIGEAKDILRADERNVEAMVAMATANYRMERYELSRAILGRASDLAPERADIYFLFGLIAMDNDQTSKAIANFQKALEFDPRFPEAHNNLGLLYYDASDYEGAVEQFKAAIDAYPNFAQAHLNLGNAYKNLGKFQKAEAAFEKVTELNSDYADAYFNLGILYLDSEIPGMKTIPRLKKAIEMLNEYKRVTRGQLEEGDPANDYIQSAREKIEAERARQKMMRQMQKQGNSQQGGGQGQQGGGQ